MFTSGRRVLVPEGAITGEGVEEISVADARAMCLEDKMRRDPVDPVFYIYLSTGYGEVLGKLMLTDMEIMFDPLSDQFKGHFNYEHGDLLKNTRMGTIINYKDISGEIQKLAFEEVDEEMGDATVTRFGVQINLSHTGNFYYAKGEAKSTFEQLLQKEIPAASLCLRINAYSLLGEPLSQDKQEEIADYLISALEARIFKVKHENAQTASKNKTQSMTTVPYFDINYHNLISILNPGLENTPTLEQVNKHLPILKEMFGLHSLGDSIAHLSNQSIYPLGNHNPNPDLLFPDLPSLPPISNPLSALDPDPSNPEDTDTLSTPSKRPTTHFLSFPTTPDGLILPSVTSLYPSSDILLSGHLTLVPLSS